MGGDRGSVTVVGVVWLVVFGLLIAGGVQVGGVVVKRHEVEGAADLGALAAAAHLPDGVVVACERARWVVERSGGRLIGCAVSGWEVVVAVEGVVPLFGAVSVRAKAGPAEG
ncbi:Rv3654c family TadE-like protein [Umezawaea endophytica]|uniref:Pilus assembly protein TadG-related protein n=1 Tax=Umezawaea endophytica TaxID=1654476 RepID=A0A9X2VWK7_9PSEU|nr:Rv3654c family TadE-like protein [Umezawaea endophytica]MCS7484236.1 pilus assembly protein TadG-related protein [Umezawaea endophytica]